MVLQTVLVELCLLRVYDDIMRKTIVVVGGGTTGALATGLLATFSPISDWDIINIRSSKIPNVGVGESTTPLLMTALQRMGIAKEFVEQTNCWPKYGAIFKGWSKEDLIGGWAINGHRNDAITYLEGLTRNEVIPRSSEYVNAGMYPYDTNKESFHSPITVHIDANQTAEFIFRKFEDRVTTIYGNVTEVHINSDGIEKLSVDTPDVKWILGGKDTYFIDATGFGRVLINSFDTEFIKSDLPCNAAIFVNDEENLPQGQNGWESRCKDMVTTATTGNAGWFWNIPLKVGRGQGYVYSSDFLTEEQAAEEFSKYLSKDLDDGNFGRLSYKPGWLKTPAIKNCYAIGLAAGFLDALDSPSIGQTAAQIFRFMRMLKNPDPQGYTKFVSKFYKKLNDYLLLHYKTCNRTEPFWKSIEKFTEEDLIDRYINILEEVDWTGNQGFLLSQSSRVINNRVNMSTKVASSIYDTLSKNNRLSITREIKTVPWTKNIFMKHVEYGNENTKRKGKRPKTSTMVS